MKFQRDVSMFPLYRRKGRDELGVTDMGGGRRVSFSVVCHVVS